MSEYNEEKEKSLNDLILDLNKIVEQIEDHFEYNKKTGPLKIFEAVSSPILPLLHNYKWRELILVDQANSYLSNSPGIHGSDGKRVEEIESKSAKIKGKTLKLNDVVGMYDKIASRIDLVNDLDVEIIMDEFKSTDHKISENVLIAMIKEKSFKYQGGNLLCTSTRRAKKLLNLLLENNNIERVGDCYKMGSAPWKTVDWNRTLLTMGVARHDYSVFGLFGNQEKPLLTLLCNSSDIEEQLGDKFEACYDVYSEKMKSRKIDNNSERGTSARDCVKISIGDILKLNSLKILNIDFGLLWNEKIKLDDAMIDKLNKLSNSKFDATFKNQLEKYLKKYTQYENELKKANEINNSLNKKKNFK